MQYYAVIDTNVLVSAMLKFSSIPGQIIKKALIGEIVPILCEEILNEYRQVLERPKFKFDKNNVNIVIDGIIDKSIFVDAATLKVNIPDPKDIVFYETVIEGNNKFGTVYLVTGNIKHFPKKSFIVTPKEMLDIVLSSDY